MITPVSTRKRYTVGAWFCGRNSRKRVRFRRGRDATLSGGDYEAPTGGRWRTLRWKNCVLTSQHAQWVKPLPCWVLCLHIKLFSLPDPVSIWHKRWAVTVTLVSSAYPAVRVEVKVCLLLWGNFFLVRNVPPPKLKQLKRIAMCQVDKRSEPPVDTRYGHRHNLINRFQLRHRRMSPHKRFTDIFPAETAIVTRLGCSFAWKCKTKVSQ